MTMLKKHSSDSKDAVIPLSFYQGSCLDGNSPHHHQESRSRDALNEVSQFFMQGYNSPTDELKMNGDLSQNKKPLPSPSYNRDPTPYFSHKNSPKNLEQNQDVARNKSDRTSEANDKREDKQITLDEILNMCSEYERQIQSERSKPVQNRIKTNGSLPREKRTIDSPSQNESPITDGKDSKEKKVHTYENVTIVSGSPRPRIKTFLTKDSQQQSPVTLEQNKIPLLLEFNFPPSPREKHNASPLYANTTSSSEASPEVKSSEKMESESNGRPLSITEITTAMKYNFLGYNPRHSPGYSDRDSADSAISSQAQWSNQKLSINSFPDYEILTGPEPDIDDSQEVIRRPEDDLPHDKLKELLEEKDLIHSRLSTLKSQVKELEKQEQELIQETALEEALVIGEISAQDDKLAHEEKRVAILKERANECDRKMEKCLEQQAESQDHFNMVRAKHTTIIETLESKISSCPDNTLKFELKESLKQQLDLLDSERKAHELLEFQLLEEEASWLSKKEDLQEELDEATARLEARRTKVESLKKAQPNLGNQLEIERITHLKAIEAARNRLNEINKELENLNLKNREEEKAVVRRRVTTSQDDLDRISRVTSGAPMDMGSCNSLGRRAIASLQEIERNRQIHLAKQGSIVIQEERQRVEELKKRVQDEVKAQWQLNRNSNCQSYTSATSDSSLEPICDSGVSSEEAEKGPQSVDETEKAQTPVEASVTPESRPLSDASGYSDEHTPIKMRSKSSMNLQRPLTRYLPIRSETLDLRKHIETAGHQIDLCPHIIIDSTSCRGYLNKMSTKFNSRWNKRWFVFDRYAGTFVYYLDKSEKKQRGGACFQAMEEVYVDHLQTFKSPNFKVTFVVKSTNRLYHLEAPSPEAMRIWVDVIFTGAEGYQQYGQI